MKKKPDIPDRVISGETIHISLLSGSEFWALMTIWLRLEGA